jgi:hypothetical protein
VASTNVSISAEITLDPEIALAFKDTYRMLFQRIGIFTALSIRSLDKLSLQNKLREIGHMNTNWSSRRDYER